MAGEITLVLSLVRKTTLMTLPGFGDVLSFSFSVADMVVFADEPPSSVTVVTPAVVSPPCVLVKEGAEVDRSLVVFGRVSVVELCG